MVHREMEKLGLGVKVDGTLEQIRSICRLRANPERERQGGIVPPPPSVSALGSALGACRHGALSSAQATRHSKTA
jgi:hypothetical protein